MELELNMIQTTALAVIIYHFGVWIKSKVNFLEKFCIPAPVVGGLLFAIVNLILNQKGLLHINFDTTLQSPAMILFFTSVGFNASIDLVKKGGIQVGIFWFLATAVAVMQNVISLGLSNIIKVDPLLSILCGSVTMIGGHGTGGAFGNLFAEKYGLEGAVTAAMAAATFGLIMGSLIGGPIGRRLIEKHKLQPNGNFGIKGQNFSIITENTAEKLDAKELFESIMVVLVAMALGSVIEIYFDLVDITLPSYIGAMIIATLILNIGQVTGKWEVNTKQIEVLGNIGLNVFLSLALMTLKLWELADIAGPMLIILIIQTFFMTFMTYFVVFRFMGKDYDAAVMAAGMSGFGMGATPNAIANMEAVTEQYGPAPRAFFVVPIVGAFLIDLTNTLAITVFLNILV